jgi:TP901 family phage tail tape measure protein
MAASRDTIFRYVFDVTGDQDLANTAGLLVKMADGSKLADTETLALANSLKTLTAQSKAVNDALSQKAGLAETANNLKAAQEAFARLRAETDTSITSSKKYQTALAAAEQSVVSLTSKQNLQQAALTKTEGSLQKAGIDTSNLAAASASLGTQAAAVAVNLGRVGAAASTAASGTSRIASAAETVKESFLHVTEGIGEFIKKAGEITGIAGIIGGLIAAVSGFKFFEAGAEEATHFDQALGKLRATTELTSQQFEAIKTKIEAVSTALDLTATEGAQAASKLSTAFGDANKGVEALSGTLELVKAAQIDVATAADIVATSIKAFGLEASDATKVADVLATVSLKTGQDLSTLGATFAQLAPFAKAVGLSFTDTAAILGVLATKGIDSATALGGLRPLFEGLRNPTSQLNQELVGLGINTSSFQSIIAGLAAAGPRAEAALDSLGTRGKASILALVQDGGAGLKAFEANLGNAAGAAKRAGDAIENNLLDAFKDFGNNLKNLAGSLLGGALDPIKEEVQALTAQIKSIPESAGFQSIRAAITEFARSAVTSFESLLRSIDFTKVGQSVADFVKGAREGFGSLIDGIKSFGATASAVTDTVGLAFHAVEAAIFASAAAIAKAVEIAGKGMVVLSGNAGALLDKNSELVKILDSFGESADVNFARAKAAALAAAKNVDGLSSSLDRVGQSFGNVKSGADSTAPAIDKAASSADNAKAGLDGVAASGEKTAEAFGKVAVSAQDTAQAIAQARFDKAATDLFNVEHAASATAVEIDAAKNAFFAARDELQKFRPATDDAAASVAKLKSAFALLHVTSQADLDATAAAFKNAFELIDKSSAQTAAGLADRQNAFIAYAKAALAAAANISQSQVDQTKILLDSRASALGLADAITKAGVAGEGAGKRTATAFAAAKGSIDDTAQAAQALAADTSAAAIAYDRIGASAKANAATMGQVIALTIDQQAALKQLNQELERGTGLQDLSLQDAKSLLEQLGAAAGAQTQVLVQRINELQAAADRTEQAIGRMKDEAAQAQDEIDQLQGNGKDIEERRHTKKLADLKAEADAEGTANTAAYRNLVDLENKLHALKLKNAQDQGNGTQGGSGAGGGIPGPNRGTGPSPNVPAPAPAPSPRPAPLPQRSGPVIQQTLNVMLLSGDATSQGNFIRFVDKELKKIADRSR